MPGKLSPHPQIPKGKYKQVQTKDRSKVSGIKKKRGNTGELFGQKKCFFGTKHGWTSKTNILNLFLDMYIFKTNMLILDIWIHQYFQTLHVGSLPCLETSRALLSNFSAFHSHFISIQHNLNPDPRAGENFYNFQGQTTHRRSAGPLLIT